MPIHSLRARRLILATIAMTMAWAGSSACGPFQYYDGTGLHDATAPEVAGVWENIEDTRVDLRRDGTAVIRRLDGQGFDFDAGWRLSGTGSWELTDHDGGQVVDLVLTKRTDSGTRIDSAGGAARPSTTGAPQPAPPATYTWHFDVDRDDHGRVALFFFYGDPDAGNTYAMSRPTPSRP
ncbi:hypothetical protein ACFW6S_31975 [Streptomyces sp. NPDC058740]|uniref:hypothetical protein n=1 Tax=Streptomyces sp. NPDC058740 TaxID=3346619 RepID=UPI0036A79DEB